MAGIIAYYIILIFFVCPWSAYSNEGICGGILESSSGVITSPGYPENYPANVSCVWDIHAPLRSNITLILNSVDLESNPRNCPNGDYIQIWGEMNGQSLSRSISICGNISQALVLNNVDNRMRILFRSDSSGARPGFSASFTSIPETGCGEELYDRYGEIASPRYPNLYPADKRCVWDITVPVGHRIVLNFTDFELENQTSTCPDKVVIWSRLMGRQFRRQVKYCGSSLPPAFTSNDNKLRIEFKSDRTIERKGFSAYFYSVDGQIEQECNEHQFRCNQSQHCIPLNWVCDETDDCGDSSDETNCQEVRRRRRMEKCSHNVSSPFGQITSPLYRQENEKGVDCSWYFKTLPGHKIKLNFQDFALREHPDMNQDCNVDRMTFYQGSSRHAPIADYFCGLQELPMTVISQDVEMFVTLKTNSSRFWKGFNLTHSTECGGDYEAKDLPGTFYSHAEFGKKEYNSNISCTWSIHAQEGKRVELNFTIFEVCQNELDDSCVDSSELIDTRCDFNDERECGKQTNPDQPVCDNDYVEVLEDKYSLKMLVAKLCGRTIPERIVSTDNSLQLNFVTNGSGGSRGFSVRYRAIDERQ